MVYNYFSFYRKSIHDTWIIKHTKSVFVVLIVVILANSNTHHPPRDRSVGNATVKSLVFEMWR